MSTPPRIPRLPRLSGLTDYGVAMAALSEWAAGVESIVGRASLPDVDQRGRQVQGHLDAMAAAVTFDAPDVDVPVPHRLGEVVHNAPVLRMRCYDAAGARADGHVTIQSGFAAPTERSITLRAHFTDPIKRVVAVVLVAGARR